jgi:hypothetical protein
MEMIKSGIILAEESVLWHGKVEKIGINSRNLRIKLYIGLGLFVIIFTMIFMIINIKFYVLTIFINFNAIFFMVLAFCHRLHVLNLIDVEYYITDRKVFDRNIIKENDNNYYEYQILNFLYNIDKIIIHPIKMLKKKVAHIDFYSNKIKKNKSFFFFRIKKDTAQREPTDFWRICTDYDKIRFYYVKDFETVKYILLKNFPDKIQIL